VTISADDGKGGTAQTQFALTVNNVAPTITSITPNPAQGLSGLHKTTFSFQGAATDPSSVDTAAGFNWQWSVDGGAYTSRPNPLTTSFSSCGSHTASATATDKDNGVSAPSSVSTISVYSASFKAPLNDGMTNIAQKGRVIPVKISVGCGTTNLTGLAPAIQLFKGDVDPLNETMADPVETYSVSAADTMGIMRTIDGGYIYNLLVPSNANSGDLFTIRVRPFGDSNPAAAMYSLLKIK
jgi:hypothetical protein